MQKLDRELKYLELRKNFNEFKYKSHNYKINENGLDIWFEFNIDDKFEFKPSLFIPNQPFINFNSVSTQLIENIVFNIGMVELISYWKSICPKKVKIETYNLTKSQIEFWKKIYFHGLGEFFYLNSISASYEDFMIIESNVNGKKMKSQEMFLEDKILIPVGGGKDSVVSLEILKNIDNNLALIMNPRGATIATANIAGFEEKTLIVNRKIDKLLLDLNEKGYLNGHTPFSALLAFVSILSAVGANAKYIALSNESSANESTVVGTKINHQYSKSLEFEADFRNYVKENISPDLQYFSILRPLSELQIASIFAKNKSYFQDFRSCNAGSKTNSWCGKCSKCLFTFIILSPFVKPEELVKIFGKNLLSDKELLNYFKELTGISEVKPFECVGTVDEVNAALILAKDFYPNEKPFLLDYFIKEKNMEGAKLDKKVLLSKIEIQHFLEPRFLKLLKNKLEI